MSCLKPFLKKYNFALTTILFLLIVILLYLPSLNNLNLFWDDDRFIFSNPLFNKASSWIHFWNPSSQFFKTWALGYTQFWFLNKTLGINNLIVYKALNITLHLFNAYLIYYFSKKICIKYPIIAAIIFFIHPLHVETISWIFQLLTILSFTFFIFSCILIYHFSLSDKKKYILLSFLFFLASLSTKSIAIFAPFIFIIIFILNKVSRLKYFFLIPFFLLSLCFGILLQQGSIDLTAGKKIVNGNYSLNNITPFENSIMLHPLNKFKSLRESQNNHIIDTFFDFGNYKTDDIVFFDQKTIVKTALIHYPMKLILPTQLSFIYPYQDISWVKFFTYVTIFTLSIFGLYFYLLKNKNFILSISIIFFSLLPYMGISFITFYYWSPVSDRYTYFSLFGFSMIVSQLFELRIRFKSYILIFYITALSIINASYGYKFNNPLLMYQHLVKVRKHPVFYSLLIEQYLLKLKYSSAKKILDQALQEFPKDNLIQNDIIRVEALRLFYKNNNIKEVNTPL